MYEATTPTTSNYISTYRDGVQPYTYTVGDSTVDDDVARNIKVKADGTERPRVAAPAIVNAMRVQAFHSYPSNVLWPTITGAPRDHPTITAREAHSTC